MLLDPAGKYIYFLYEPRAPESSIKPVRVVFEKNVILLFFEVYIHYATIICHCDILFEQLFNNKMPSLIYHVFFIDPTNSHMDNCFTYKFGTQA